ncbi:MAG: nickel pincer cofactor biosynthesis protein LarC [Bacillati bacterium ANGP1]|uniref:Putative nickel insertion protein n=1 Tax=Candidatus Segetimicrobium genomatis TaxID=2569760 RepID=A0A537K616_9BACT|nr:MAG: nickel pincer cofactor biosynthesis protein LarC [Terrabacteria group bacterium ANGP1]
MRIGYLDCASGASGDMLLGALLGAGWTEAALRDLIGRLGVPVRIAVGRVHRQSVPAVRVEVQETEPPRSRRYPVLARVLADASLEPALRDSAAGVLRRLAAAEAEIHATPIEEVHLHELGGVDTLVDIVGVLAGVRALNLDRLIASPVNLGRGWAETGHGTVPVPAPATSALIAGMPVYAGEVEGELLTPTGAVLLSSLVTRWGALPLMRLERIGTGAGAADPPRANVLRVFVGEALGDPDVLDPRAGAAAPSDEERAERLAVLETSIDDMNPQLYPHVTARLLDAGALDVMTIPAVMKKGRPGHLLRVLAPPDRVRALYGILLAETTTLGVRVYEVSRLAARRRRVEVETEYGVVAVKIAEDRSGVLNMAPEFDACRALAERHGVPLKRVLAAAQRAAEAIEARVGRG